MSDTVSIELTRDELRELQDKLRVFGEHGSRELGGTLTGDEPVLAALRRKLASASMPTARSARVCAPQVVWRDSPGGLPRPAPATATVRVCDCELRDRKWNTNTGKCEFCHGAYARGAA